MFEDNQLLSTGVSLGLMGVGFRYSQMLFRAMFAQFRRKYMISLEINNSDKSFVWILNFINNRKNVLSNHVSASTVFVDDRTKFLFVPSPGIHWMRYKNRYFLVERTRETGSLNIQTGVPFESVKFTTFGNDSDIFKKILEESQKQAKITFDDKTLILKSNAYTWEQFGTAKKKRPLNSVVIDPFIKDAVLKDIEKFLISFKWYESKGIPYRRTYLFHGPPGSGKTSFITALAGKFDFSIALISLNENVTDDQFAKAMSCVPERTIVVMEDVDAIFSQRKTAPDGFRHGISFSGLLNVLDGVYSSDSRIIFMTTNHIEKLDRAVIRPGRVDMIRYFGNASEFQAKEMFLRFFEGEFEKADDFGRKVGIFKRKSVAEIQEYLMRNKNCASTAVDGVEKWIKI